MPDGSVRVIRRPEREGDARRGERRWHGRREGYGKRHDRRAGHSHAEHSRAERPRSDEERQAHRARRKLAREIVRALEESGYGKIDKA